MAPEEVLELNGDFKNSPLLATVRRLREAFSSLETSYTVVGGLAVLRNGAPRTTIDVDILTTKEGWELFRRSAPGGFAIKADSAVDERNGVAIGVVFTGDGQDMVIPLPDPEAAAEYDAGLGGNFSLSARLPRTQNRSIFAKGKGIRQGIGREGPRGRDGPASGE